MTARSERVVPAAEIAPVLDELHARLMAEGPDAAHLAQVHEFLDIDPDIADRPYPPMPWARRVPGVYPDTSSRTNYEATDTAGYVTRAYDGDCAPEFTPRPVADVETGGRL